MTRNTDRKVTVHIIEYINPYDLAEKLIENNKLRIALVSTFFMSLFAHAYSYFNASFTMDRFRWFGNSLGILNVSAISSGKWFATALDFLSHNSYLPWLNGLLTIIFLAYSVYVICRVMHVETPLGVWIVAGLIVTDLSIIHAHLYFVWGFAEALALVCVSLHVWENERIRLWERVVIGALFVGFSLATYGSYTSIGLAIVNLACIIMLINGEECKKVLSRGVEYIVSFLGGLLIYYSIQRILLKVLDIEMISYMGEDKLVKGTSIQEVLYLIEIAFKNAVLRYMGVYRTGYSVMPQWVAIALLVLGGAMLIMLVFTNKGQAISPKSILLLSFLIAIFPLSSGSIYVMAFGNVHQLMLFAFVSFYIGLVRLSEMCFRNTNSFKYESERLDGNALVSVVKAVCSGLVIILMIGVIYKGILVANMVYSRLDNLYEISNNIAVRVLDRIESCEGFEGDEHVYLVGDVTDSNYFSNSRYTYSDALDLIDGMLAVDKSQANVFLYYSHFIMLMKENTEVNLDIDYYNEGVSGFSDSERSEINDMPCFPADGSVNKLGDSIVVKFAENQ